MDSSELIQVTAHNEQGTNGSTNLGAQQRRQLAALCFIVLATSARCSKPVLPISKYEEPTQTPPSEYSSPTTTPTLVPEEETLSVYQEIEVLPQINFPEPGVADSLQSFTEMNGNLVIQNGETVLIIHPPFEIQGTSATAVIMYEVKVTLEPDAYSPCPTSVPGEAVEAPDPEMTNMTIVINAFAMIDDGAQTVTNGPFTITKETYYCNRGVPEMVALPHIIPINNPPADQLLLWMHDEKLHITAVENPF